MEDSSSTSVHNNNPDGDGDINNNDHFSTPIASNSSSMVDISVPEIISNNEDGGGALLTPTTVVATPSTANNSENIDITPLSVEQPVESPKTDFPILLLPPPPPSPTSSAEFTIRIDPNLDNENINDDNNAISASSISQPATLSIDEVDLTPTLTLPPHNSQNQELGSMIKVTNGNKSYGSQHVLQNLNIDVQQGTIYALLGASGCGKTTLLSCIVGIKTLNSGTISFGGEDLEDIKCHGGLRQSVGYMPQELALYKEFTIKEALLYFGRIFGMSKRAILKQGKFLVEFLHLPKWNTEIRQMSGGQQRRTSFAVALIHSPKLLILDEPTVGVDPLLRQSIWAHLTKMVTESKATVIITTHYIDEAKSADTVGLMRNGRILAEGSPQNLLEQNQCLNLEHLFLVLSELDETKMQKASSQPFGKEELEVTIVAKHKPLPPHRRTTSIRHVLFPYPGYFSRLHALTMKNFVYIWRQLLFIFFLLLFPALQIFLCCWALGTEPWDLPFGVINHEISTRINKSNNNVTSCEMLVTGARACDANFSLSCSYIEALSELETFKLRHYSTEEEAIEDMTRQGAIYGYMIFPENFTNQYLPPQPENTRVNHKFKIHTGEKNHTVENSQQLLHVQLDMTSRHITISIQRALLETFQTVMRNRLKQCSPGKGQRETARGPIKYDKPLYGHSDQTIIIDYVGPGLVLGVMFFAAISVTGLTYVVEKKEGMLERSIVAGVSTSEIITAHLLSQCAIVIVQTIICLLVLFGIFKVPIHGPIEWVIVLTVLQGFLGMFAGFVLSSVCDEEKVVMQWSLAITLPMVVVAGIFWPTAGMPIILQYIAHIFVPQTYASEAIRSMLSRGWGICHPKVWPGFAITIGYSILLWIIANIFAKRSVSPKK